MATIVVVFKILFLILIAHSFVAPSQLLGSSAPIEGTTKSISEKQAAAFQSRSRSESEKTLLSAANANNRSKRHDDDENNNNDRETKEGDQTELSSSGAAASSGTSDSNSGRTTQLRPQVNYAELCYLADGGSSITLTVNEATQVGSIIGTVEVNGDPSLEGGNVDLFEALENALAPSAIAHSQHQVRQQQVGSSLLVHEPSSAAIGSIGAAESGGRQRSLRLLGRRSAPFESATLSESTSASTSFAGANDEGNSSSPVPTTSEAPPTSRRSREPKMLLGSSAPPPPPLPLVSSQQSTSSVTFYSLLSAAAAAATQQQQQQQQQQQPQHQIVQTQSAVRLEPGTKNLILVRQLDKESAEGEQSLLLNIRCSPRMSQATSNQQEQHTTDPVAATNNNNNNNRRTNQARRPTESTTIPVRILVTDANDHAPEFVGAQPYVVNISETAPVGAIASRDILALDRDSAGPFSTLHYRVLDEQANGAGSLPIHLGLLQFTNPLDPTLMVSGPLDYETLGPSFTLTIQVQDQGEPEPLFATAQLQVNIIDFDDQNPRFSDDKYTLIMDETQQTLVGQNLQVLPRNLHAEDGDRGILAPIVYSFDQLGRTGGASFFVPELGSSTTLATQTGVEDDLLRPNGGEEPSLNVEQYLHLNPTSGEIRLIRQWPSKWLGSPLTLVVRATQADNKDRYTLTTLTITRPLLPGTPTYRMGTGGSVSGQSHGRPSGVGGEDLQHSVDESAQRVSTVSVSGSQVSTTTPASQQTQVGIEFAPDRLVFSVPESVAINEKIARVRARYLGRESDNLSLISSSASDGQAVDLIPDWQQIPTAAAAVPVSVSVSTTRAPVTNQPNSKTRRTRVAELQQSAKRPINYQILDDQTDQFGINGLGEIFVKRQLDYELRQEYKFRVLATYTKYSDICQVQVNVLNVNDNKPKFTQPQYTFHLTESRLRSNVIGVVLAHDADLNDTIHYSLTGEHAHLFEVNSHGQISLRSSIKQLNITSCQLIVQATDSLAPQQHTNQARVHLHIAPQLVGRAINFEQSPENEAKLFNSRSLMETNSHRAGVGAGTGGELQQHQAADWHGSASFNTHHRTLGGVQVDKENAVSGQQVPASNQRSSVATVMSSLQHMVRSVNFFDMPISSALLLSALLAFLICLLFILIISMSVHIYRRRAKSRHRHHLATGAHMRHAHLAALHSPERSRYMQTNISSSGTSSPTSSSTASPSSSPPALQAAAAAAAATSKANSASASGPNQGAGRLSSPTNSSGRLNAATNSSKSRKLVGSPTSAPTMISSKSNNLQTLEPHTLHSSGQVIGGKLTMNELANTGSRPSSAQTQRTGSRLSMAHAGQLTSNPQPPPPPPPLGALNVAQLQLQAHLTSQGGASSLISSLSSQSKRSYRSNTTDDSSVMHCGHYSINTANPSNDGQTTGHRSPGAQQFTVADHVGAEQAAGNSRQSSLEAAIKSLVREEDGETREVRVEGRRRRFVTSGSTLAQSGPQSNEMTALTCSKPGIKSYRKLPMMGSLVRPLRPNNKVADASPMYTPEQGELQCELSERQQHAARAADQKSAINHSAGSHEVPAGSCDEQDPAEIRSRNSVGLMAMVRDAEQQAIRWPSGALPPQRVKKLTWDDETNSVSGDFHQDDACFVAPDVPLAGPMSPLSNHQYPIQGTTNNEDHFAEQHFLFSNPCSPALLSQLVGQPAPAGVDHRSSHGNARAVHSRPPSSSGCQLTPLPDDQSSITVGQNNCFDYTIVQSSQFHVDAFASSSDRSEARLMQNMRDQQQLQPQAHQLQHQRQKSLSAQHHLLQQQLHLADSDKRPTVAASYLYSNSGATFGSQQAAANHRDLRLMTTAVL